MEARPGEHPSALRRGRSEDWALLLGLMAVGLLLRWPGLNNSLFSDELSSFFLTGHSVSGLLHLLNGHSVDLTPPLYFVIAHDTRVLFGDSVQSMRLISLIAGLASIPLTYLVGRWTVGRVPGLLGAAIVAASPYLIDYSTEARAYALLMALSLASTLCLVRAVQGGAVRWWIGYAVCACATVYTHYTGVFLLAAQFGWAFFTSRPARRSLLLASAAAVIGFLPWVPVLLRNSRSVGAKVIGYLEPFGLHSIRFDLGRWLVGRPYVPLASEPGTVAIALIGAGAILAAAGAAVHRRRLRPTQRRDASLMLALALATPVGLALYSLVGNSVWDLRNLISSWPGVALVIGTGVAMAPRRVGALAAVLLLGGFAVGGAGMLRADQQRPDYLSAARFIERTGGPRDPVVEVAGFTPGPPTAMEAALALQPDSRTDPHPVLRLGLAPLRAVLRAPPYAALPAPTPAAVARDAGTMARRGTIFLVSLGDAPASALQAARGHAGPTQAGAIGFLHALPARFRIVGTRSFRAGFAAVSVYVVSDR